MLKIALIPFLLLNLYAMTPAQTLGSSSIKKGQGGATSGAPDQAGNESLIESIKSSDLPRVLRLLEKGASPDATDDNGALALCWAVRMNSPDIIKALLARGARVNQGEDDGGDALQVAAATGHGDLVKLLMEHGADIRHKDRGGHTALLCAAFGAMIKTAPAWLAKSLLGVDEDDEILTRTGSEHSLVAHLLLDWGADVNAQAEDCGLTPLMVAAMSGNVELAKVLLAHRADINVKGRDWTALKFAEEFTSPESLRKELAGFDDDESKQAVLNWIHFTASGRREVAELLRKAGAR